jgi:hypothetical protein
MPLIYMSFADPNKPEGTQFLGAAIVEADDLAEATKKTWRLGINPGGEVLSFEVPEELEHRVYEQNAINKLLSFEDLDSLEHKYTGHGVSYLGDWWE